MAKTNASQVSKAATLFDELPLHIAVPQSMRHPNRSAHASVRNMRGLQVASSRETCIGNQRSRPVPGSVGRAKKGGAEAAPYATLQPQ